MAVETRWTPVGAPAFDALVDVVAAAQDHDRLAPLTVVTPTPTAAVALRRALARARRGTVGVAFTALDALAEQLAAPQLGGGVPVGVDREVVVAAVRAELSREPGAFVASAGHRSTWETLAATVDELSGLTADARATIAAEGSSLAREAVRIHDAVVESVGVGGRARTYRAALDRLAIEPRAAEALGPVVAFVPTALDAMARELLRSIGDHGRLVVIGGLTGVDAADDRAIANLRDLGATPPPAAPPEPSLPTTVISTNDVDDEIRAAIRALLRHADAGHPLHEMALVHPDGAPYARAVAEALGNAGVPFSGASADTLGHTAAGRVLLGLLEVDARRFRREVVIDLWSSGLVVDADGRALPSVRLDHRSRRLGVLVGRDDWDRCIAARRDWLVTHPPEATTDPERDRRVHARIERELDELDRLHDALATLAECVDALPTRWEGVGDWAGRVLDTLCGGVVHRASWPTHELEADTALRTTLGRLDALASIDPDPGPDVVRDTVRSALESPAPRRTRQGTGIQVGTLSDAPVTPMSAVAVIGLAEGHLPRVGRDDVLLPDDVRAAAGLPTIDDATGEQRRALATALASGRDERVVTYARCDQRSGRTQVPSRWLVDLLEQATGTRPRTEPLMSGAPVAGVDVVASHRAALAAVAADGVALHSDDLRLAALASAPEFDAHPAVDDPIVHAGATLVRHRNAAAYTRFDGRVGTGIDVLSDDERHLSPTGLEMYATCPRRWFLRNGLGLHDVDRPEEVERLLPTDKGSLAHEILERFVGEAIEKGTVPDPGEPWGAAAVTRLEELAEESFAEFERRDLTGHPTWWAFDRDEIVSVLRETLLRDDVVREVTGATPVSVELSFGRDGVPPLEVELDDGRVVPLAGSADRVDVGGGAVHVYDYKFSSSAPYRGLDKDVEAGGDPLDAGRRIQLIAYAEAAAAQRGIDRASAWYWFLKPGHTGKHIGYEIGPEHRRMFRATLQVIVDGIGDGHFPAHAGPFDWFAGTNDSCGFCAFDSICPSDREDEWERVRADPDLTDLVRLADGGAPVFLVTQPVEEPAEAS